MTSQTRSVSLRIDIEKYEKFMDALIKEQSRLGQRMYISNVLGPAIDDFIRRSELAQ